MTNKGKGEGWVAGVQYVRPSKAAPALSRGGFAWSANQGAGNSAFAPHPLQAPSGLSMG